MKNSERNLTTNPEAKAEYMRHWKLRNPGKVQAYIPGKVMSESKQRRRMCRTCARPVSAGSYYYCYDHNILIGEEETTEYTLGVKVE